MKKLSYKRDIDVYVSKSVRDPVLFYNCRYEYMYFIFNYNNNLYDI